MLTVLSLYLKECKSSKSYYYFDLSNAILLLVKSSAKKFNFFGVCVWTVVLVCNNTQPVTLNFSKNLKIYGCKFARWHFVFEKWVNADKYNFYDCDFSTGHKQVTCELLPPGPV